MFENPESIYSGSFWDFFFFYIRECLIHVEGIFNILYMKKCSRASRRQGEFAMWSIFFEIKDLFRLQTWANLLYLHRQSFLK